MAKKHEMTDQEYKVYKKIHDYEHPLEVERGKIRREKADHAQYRRKSDARLKRRLREMAYTADEDTWEEDAIQAEYDARASRELRNARTHKRRLRGLEKHERRSGGSAGGKDGSTR